MLKLFPCYFTVLRGGRASDPQKMKGGIFILLNKIFPFYKF